MSKRLLKLQFRIKQRILDVVSDIKREIERISNTVMLRYRDCDDERCLQQKLDKFPTYKLSREPFLAGLKCQAYGPVILSAPSQPKFWDVVAHSAHRRQP